MSVHNIAYEARTGKFPVDSSGKRRAIDIEGQGHIFGWKAGTPTDGTSGDLGFCPGAMFVDYTNALTYVNTLWTQARREPWPQAVAI